MCTTNDKWVMNLLRNFDFIKARIEETSLNLHATYYLHHGSFSHFHILWDVGDKYARCHHKVPHFG
jgi:hypothetical protein